MDCSPPGSSVHGDSLGKSTGLGCHALLQGIFQPRSSALQVDFLPSDSSGKPKSIYNAEQFHIRQSSQLRLGISGAGNIPVSPETWSCSLAALLVKVLKQREANLTVFCCTADLFLTAGEKSWENITVTSVADIPQVALLSPCFSYLKCLM